MRQYPNTKNISWHLHKYAVFKCINGENKCYGHYPTLIMALMVRDDCIAHGWSEQIREKYVQRRKKDNDLRYITKVNNKYVIKYPKGNRKHRTYFGAYSTLIIALMMRDKLESVDWEMIIPCNRYGPKLPKYITYRPDVDKFYLSRNVDGKYIYYGSFSTLQKAVKERDLYIECDWDLDLVCSLY